MSRSSLFLPLFLIIFGAVWFLKTTDILPATSTIVSAGSGPLLVYIGAAVYLHNQYWLGYSPLVALGMMVLGCLLLLSRSDMVPYKQHKQQDN